MKKAIFFFVIGCALLTLYSFSNEMPIRLNYRKLNRTPVAQHTGDGDEELKAFYKVHLTGHFTLAIRNGILFGDVYANFKEIDPGPNHKYRGTDNTEFIINYSYPVYQPKPGFEVRDFKILYGTQTTSDFDFMGRDWEQDDAILSGPLTAMHWVGDTGDKGGQDQIFGCYIEPYLKRIDVLVQEKK